ncbi:TauD/TfdA family dioxygenase [Kibdelosporangium aridum]|uniref:TauD/TfdA family dioxygenase n=1 Tax=Kibdelosporangium aridum TaxID=2030 RepID=UPI0035ED3DE4
MERPAGHGDLRTWLHNHSDEVDEILSEQGAMLFRGFGVGSAEEFHDLVTIPLGDLMQYIEGASPRAPLGGGVYTSTEYSPELTVSMHNELSYSHQWPTRLAFFCKTPATTGGQTPIANSRKVFQRITSNLAPPPSDVCYVRHMPEKRGPGVDWPTVFSTDDKNWIEGYCRTAGIHFAWLDDGSLRTSQVRPSAIKHPQTGEAVWFNQAHQWHPSNAGKEVEDMLREAFGEELPMNARLGNDAEFDDTTLQIIRQAYRDETIAFDWEVGDVMVIDNMLSAHGRTPFTGQREVLVAMGKPIGLADVQRVDFGV